MKIAISMTGVNSGDNVDARFGRCKCFMVTDTETGASEIKDNTAAASSGGAGISAAQMVVASGAKAVLTGRCGPNASKVLDEAGVRIISGVEGKAKDVIEAFKNGRYKAD